MRSILILSVLVASCTWGLIHAVADVLDAPDVHISYTTGECVRIIDENGERKCPEQLPAKYHRVWVE